MSQLSSTMYKFGRQWGILAYTGDIIILGLDSQEVKICSKEKWILDKIPLDNHGIHGIHLEIWSYKLKKNTIVQLMVRWNKYHKKQQWKN